MGLRQHLLSTVQRVSLSVHVGSIGLSQAWEVWFGIPVLEMATPLLQFEEVLCFCNAKLGGITFCFLLFHQNVFLLALFFWWRWVLCLYRKGYWLSKLWLFLFLFFLSCELRWLIGYCCCADGMWMKCGRSWEGRDWCL